MAETGDGEDEVSLLAYATASSMADGTGPEALLLFAHQDDESIGLGGRLNRLASGRCIHVTDGAPRSGLDATAHGFGSIDEYRRARDAELRHAMAAAGAATMRRATFGFADQEAALHLADLTMRLVTVLADDPADVLFTHPYEGGHPDHDACAFAAQRAVAILSRRRRAPRVVECAFYHAGRGGIEAGAFLDPSPGTARTTELTRVLSAEERQRKWTALTCFATQRTTLALFSVDRESFRIAPEYDFERPPHPGPVHYERFPWGMTPERFCELAREADRTLVEAAREC